jgi:cytoplasmic iron level regulating protein YaaA (DUF328/UPF0246 family)
MYIIISPSKTQNFSRDFSKEFSGGKISEGNFSVSEFNEDTKKISKIMKKFSKKDLEKMMKISEKSGELNFGRFQKWSENFSVRKKIELFENKKVFLQEAGLDAKGPTQPLNKPGFVRKEFNFSPAIFAFTGDVYRGFDLEN